MTPAQHYAEAERLREHARDAQSYAYDGNADGWGKATYFNDAAQVHATLALAGATFLTHSSRVNTAEHNAFMDAISRDTK